MKKIILLVLVIIFALRWTNHSQKPTIKIPQKKPTAIKQKKLKTNPVNKIIPATPKISIPADYQCDGKTTCSQMNSCQEAKFYLQDCGLNRLDRDRDGIPCEGRWCFKKPNQE